MTHRLRLAVAGTGFFSQFHFDSWARLPIDLKGICSLDEETARRTASSYGDPDTYTCFETMLDETKPDLVDIITPPPTHYQFASLAIDRNIPVICQKPFCTSSSEARKLADQASEAGVPLIVHENFRFQPWYRKIAELLSSELVGDVYTVYFFLRPGDGQGPDAYLARQPYFQKQERFLIRETAVHLIDVFRFLMGEVVSVTADLRRLNPCIAGEDAGTVIFRMENGVRCIFDGNRLADHPATNRRLTMGELAIEGSAGTLRLNGDGNILMRSHGSNCWEEIAYQWNDSGYAGDCVHAFQSHALDHIRDGRPVENTAQAYLANLLIEETVYAANGLGQTIELNGAKDKVRVD